MQARKDEQWSARAAPYLFSFDARRRRVIPAFISDRLDQGAVAELDG
jgi:hypothetical protein